MNAKKARREVEKQQRKMVMYLMQIAIEEGRRVVYLKDGVKLSQEFVDHLTKLGYKVSNSGNGNNAYIVW